MFRLSLRETFLVILVLALGIGWLVDRNQLRKTAQRWHNAAGALEYAFTKYGGKLEWDKSEQSPYVWAYHGSAMQGMDLRAKWPSSLDQSETAK